MKNIFVWLVVAVIVVGGIIWYVNYSAEPQPQQSSITVALNTQNNSGESGTATLTDSGGKTIVTLALSGAPEGTAQPAHIHTGSCANIGGVLYPLVFPVNGVSETTLDVSLDVILSQLPLALNVHKSPDEVNVYVACGDLVQ
ncbi:MAG: Cu-zn Superoxide dismutase [Parcubacteria group bacterium GW2011_GWA2_51_10]|nr:MAG: Cu-zn Superoxide dismutase [Parcubacteria group bacterium GW2011_GWA2_51_10]